MPYGALRTVLFFSISAALYIAGIITTGSNKNLLTIVAVLGFGNPFPVFMIFHLHINQSTQSVNILIILRKNINRHLRVKIFFAQETLDKFMGGQSDQSAGNDGFGGPWVEKSAVYAKKSRQMTNPASENKPHRDRKTDGASSAASETAIYQQAYRTLSDIRVFLSFSVIFFFRSIL